MNVSYLAIFNSKPILERAYMGSTSGRLKYAVKKNLRKFESHFEDTLEWLKADAMDNGWKIEDTLPLTDADCPKCEHEKAYYWLVQTRAGDEADTKFLKCEKCKHTSRNR